MIDVNIYDRTLRGEPIYQPVTPTRMGRSTRPPLLRAIQNGLWLVGDWLVGIPTPVVRPAPHVQVMSRELRQWTGWSARQLADVLGTSHTTVLAVEDGRPLLAGRSGDLSRRLDEVHTVVSRIHVLTNGEATRTAYVLSTPPARGLSASEHLKRRAPGRAYVAALDVLQPPAEGLVVGSRPARPGRATAPLHD
jgi:hypothetical protein